MVPLLIPAAGSGKRMGADCNKLLLPLLDRPILQWTLEAVIAAKGIDWIGIIAQPHDMEAFTLIIENVYNIFGADKPVTLIEGGDTRQQSVFNGINALPHDTTQVLIHDGARCLATPALFTRCVQALEVYKDFITAIPVKDTIKVVEENVILETPNRLNLWSAQTPQGFVVNNLRRAHQQALIKGWTATDDASLVENLNLPVQVIVGEETNIKITTPFDLQVAEMILKNRFSIKGS
jgi:2-C-methyl-D-erythritol 4-phosphate cytidylyltransferase